MDALSSMFREMGDWMTAPFKGDIPISRLILSLVLFAVLAFVIYDGLRILKSWMEAAAETAAEAVS